MEINRHILNISSMSGEGLSNDDKYIHTTTLLNAKNALSILGFIGELHLILFDVKSAEDKKRIAKSIAQREQEYIYKCNNSFQRLSTVLTMIQNKALLSESVRIRDAVVASCEYVKLK